MRVRIEARISKHAKAGMQSKLKSLGMTAVDLILFCPSKFTTSASMPVQSKVNISTGWTRVTPLILSLSHLLILSLHHSVISTTKS